MKTRKYKLKAAAKINGEWHKAGEEVELTEDLIQRLEAQTEKTNVEEPNNG